MLSEERLAEIDRLKMNWSGTSRKAVDDLSAEVGRLRPLAGMDPEIIERAMRQFMPWYPLHRTLESYAALIRRAQSPPVAASAEPSLAGIRRCPVCRRENTAGCCTIPAETAAGDKGSE